MRNSVYASAATMLLFFTVQSLPAQEKWDLRRCVDYAVANNISIKQADVQAQVSETNFKQSKLGIWPTANFSNSYGYQFGRSIDPTSNAFINQQISSSSVGLSSGVTLFNFFAQKNTILGNEKDVKAQSASVQKLKDDISLYVANFYLQCLLSREQANISLTQLNLTREQLTNTRKLVAAGSLPELNAAELEAQLARDSSTYVVALSTYTGNILSLKNWMNLDPALPFDIDTPPVEMIPIETFAELQPELVYELALKNMPIQRVNQFRLESLDYYQKAAKARLYPSIRAFGQLNSNFSSLSQQFSGYGFFTQLNNNFSQSLGLSLSVPIFNGWQAKANWQRSKLSYQNQQLQVDKDNQSMKQDIYKAYNDATAAYQRYQASIKTVKTAEYSYELSRKRYEAGLLRSIDLITNQNNLFKARLEKSANQFEYVFRMKVLEFYKGQGLKL